MSANDIIGILMLTAFIAMTIYFQVKSKQLANEKK